MSKERQATAAEFMGLKPYPERDAPATPKPRAGEHTTERERVAERIVQALHADFTTFNKAKVMLLLQPLSGIWPEPWQTEINKVAAERDALRSRNAELVEALRRAVGWVGATGNGKPVVDPRQLEDYNFARAVLAKAPT